MSPRYDSRFYHVGLDQLIAHLDQQICLEHLGARYTARQFRTWLKHNSDEPSEQALAMALAPGDQTYVAIRQNLVNAMREHYRTHRTDKITQRHKPTPRHARPRGVKPVEVPQFREAPHKFYEPYIPMGISRLTLHKIIRGFNAVLRDIDWHTQHDRPHSERVIDRMMERHGIKST